MLKKYQHIKSIYGGYDINGYDDLIVVMSMLTNSYNEELGKVFYRVYDKKDKRFHCTLDHYLFVQKYPDKYEGIVKDWITRDLNEKDIEIQSGDVIMYEIHTEPEFRYKVVNVIAMEEYTLKVEDIA